MKEYTAFISYCSVDKRWAHWLKVRLDRFSYKNVSDEKHPLRYVFLDKYNLGIDPLKNKGLFENLQKSTYLLVVCSPHTPDSEYVKYEIEEFKRICDKRGDDWRQFVLPVIVGTATPQKCLPEQITNVKAVRTKSYWSLKSKEHAIAIIAAKLLGIPNPDQIWGYLKRLQRIKITFYLFMSLFILLGGYIYWEFTRIHKEYFVDYVSGVYKSGEHKDWAVGIGELSLEEVKSLNQHYRFEYKRIPLGKIDAGQWQLHRIVHANSFSFPVSLDESLYPFPRFPIEELHYSPDSIHRIESVFCYDSHHKLQQIIRINGERLNKIDIQDYRSELAFTRQTLSDFEYPLFESLGNKYANITHFEMIRDNKGQIVGMSFKAGNGQNEPFMPDTRNNIGVVFNLDSIGRITECHYSTYDKGVIYVVTYEYDSQNQLVSRNLYNKQRKVSALLVSTTYKRTKDKIEKFFIKTFDNTAKKVTYMYNKGMLESVITEKCKTNIKEGGMIIFDIIKKEETIFYEYNNKGFPKWIHYYDSNNQQVISKQITYTPNNYIKNICYRKLVGDHTFTLADGPEGYSYIDNIFTSNNVLEKSLCYQYSSNQKYFQKYEYNSSNKLHSILFTDTLGSLINMGDFNKVLVNDDFERKANATYTSVYSNRNTNKKLFNGDTLVVFGHKFPMYEKFAKRELTYDAYGNVTAIKYYNKNLNCFYTIKEWILENGFVTQSIACLVNSENYEYPLSTDYVEKKGEGEMCISPELAFMLLKLSN